MALTVSLDYAEDGNVADRHVATVARYLRKACDDPTASDLLDWLLGLRCDAQSLTALSAQLLAQLAGGHRSAPASLVTALRAVALRHPLPDPRAQVLVHLPPLEEPALSAITYSAVDIQDLSELPTGDDDLIALGMVEASEDQTPEQSSQAAKGVLIENLEALQYLEYSWQRTNPEESTALLELVQSGLTSPNQDEALLCAFVAVAVLTQHSLDTVRGVALTSTAEENWSLDATGGVLRRLPARRTGHWRADQGASSWVRPLSAQWEIILAGNLATILRKAATQAADAAQLSDLWTSDVLPEQAFNAACRQHPILQRVTSGHVRRTVQTALFRAANDAAFARLAVATPRSALPGACAYPAWQGGQLQEIWDRSTTLPWVAEIRFGNAEENVLGSELDPIDPLLRAEIASLHARLAELATDPERWAEYHNALTTYLVIALLAATGARPIDSPFESPSAFDWAQEFVYIDDKAVDSLEAGRAVPLPSDLLSMLTQIYLPHLAALAQSLGSVAPDMSVELAMLAERRASQLPFFFFLRSKPFIDWIRVSPASLDVLALVGWPLPWNLMRHRLATRLRAEWVDPEVIDGLLGHSEAGAQTWGDTSLRSWREDATDVRPALCAVFDRLHFEMPPSAGSFDLGPATCEPGRALFDGRSPFGQEARRAQRVAAHQHAKGQAAAELDQIFAGRPLSTLSKEELETIGRSMILTAKGLPRPYADLRYEVFESRVRAAWQEEGKRPPLRQRFALSRAGSSSFSAHCVGATLLLAKVCRAIDDLERPGFRQRPLNAAYLAAFAICAFDRVTDLRVLQAVIGREDIAIIVRDGRAWIEYRANARSFPNQPAPRFPICAMAARWLSIALSGRTYPMRELPKQFRELGDLLLAGAVQGKSTADGMLERLALIVGQVNVLELPGVVAAYLDGRAIAWGAPVHDWLRLHTGAAYRLPGLDKRVTEPELQSLVSEAALPVAESRYRVSKPAVPDLGSLEDRVAAGRAMLADVRRKLDDYALTTPRGTEDTSVRRNLRREIARLGKLHPHAPSAIALLTAWTYKLLDRQPDTPRFLRPSTVVRYLGALANRFLNHAHDVDLTELDDEELTELYGTMLDAGSDEGFDAGYVAQRLRDFHRFAQAEFGLEDPDWSEIGVDSAGAAGSPGLVLEAEYLHTLQSLVPDVRNASRESQCTAMLLLAGFRFGLRGREAYGLLRADWADHFKTLVVLVRSNAIRPLKTLAGRRQVPLLCQFSRQEQALIIRFMNTWDELAQAQAKVPLFALDRSGTLPSLRAMRTRICAALRASCLAPHLTFHHCRHAFASELFLALLPSPLQPRMNSARWMDPEHVQRALLGSARTTRRGLWALARTLGHARPTTTLRSYVHLLAEVSDMAVAVPQKRRALGQSSLLHATVLDGLTADPSYLRAVPAPPPAARAPLTTSMLVRAAQLLSRGQSVENAANALAIDVAVVRQLRDWISRADIQLKRTPRSEGRRTKAHQGGLLRQILRHRWPQLLSIASGDTRGTREQSIPAATVAQIGPAIQILMWRPEHFRAVAALRDDLQLNADIAVYETDDLDPDVRQWADEAGLGARMSQSNANGIRVFQIDGAFDGRPPHRVVHRCAAARLGESARLKSTAELVLLFACYAISRQGLTGSPTATSSGSAS